MLPLSFSRNLNPLYSPIAILSSTWSPPRNMPTPHDEHDETSSTPTLDISTSSATHATCPPEDRSTHTQSDNNVLPTAESSRNLVVDSAAQMPTPEEDQDPEPTRMSEPPTKPMDLDEDTLSKEARLPTPSSPVNDDTKETEPRVTPPTSVQSSPTHSSYPLSRKRVGITLRCIDIQPLTLCLIS